MTTFVLVHGAWHGGWCWTKLVPLLRKAGHEVYTPTLTGLGERSHLLTETIDLTCHIRDISNLMTYEDLRNIILVGHSYGGMVITGVADQQANRIAHLVYLDAFVPQNGESALDLMATTSAVRARTESQAHENTWLVEPESPAAFGITEPEDIAWMQARLGSQPIRTVTEKLQLRTQEAYTLRRTYISCTLDQATKMPSIARTATRVRGEDNWQYYELAAGHDPMITAPQELVKLLVRVV